MAIHSIIHATAGVAHLNLTSLVSTARWNILISVSFISLGSLMQYLSPWYKELELGRRTNTTSTSTNVGTRQGTD
jgi:hypothetical protein